MGVQNRKNKTSRWMKTGEKESKSVSEKRGVIFSAGGPKMPGHPGRSLGPFRVKKGLF